MKRKKRRSRSKTTIRLEKVLRQAMDLPYIRVEYIFSDDAREVTKVRYQSLETHSYAVCPSCSFWLEREYQQYCEMCGQRLLWNEFSKNNVTVVRTMGWN